MLYTTVADFDMFGHDVSNTRPHV